VPRKLRFMVVICALALVTPVLAVPASADGSYDAVIALSFPVPDLANSSSFRDDYHDPRGGGTRVHKATDIGHRDAYGLAIHAAVGGTVTRMTGVDEAVPGYGYSVVIAGTDGRTYTYIHLGRQDGPPTEAYAPGLHRGDQVTRGQHIGYVGHSGNASESYPHLHLEIVDPTVTDPYGTHRLNPYASLVAALERGDVPKAAERLGGSSGPVPENGGEGPADTGDGGGTEDHSGHTPRFRDVPEGHAHGASIRAIAAEGITQGCTPDLFCPARTVTRGQMATFLQRALALPATTARPFTDVPASHPHGAAIAAVAEAGIARGDGNGDFRPDVPVQRDQMASLLAAALELDPSQERPFTDVPPTSVHAGAIAALAGEGIAKGDGDGTFRPSRAIDRGQMASFLQRSFLN
jgi:hypothetical protein